MQNINKNDLKITVDVQPQDPYVQARNDFLKAFESANKLTPEQKQRLAQELLGFETFIAFYRMMRNYFG